MSERLDLAQTRYDMALAEIERLESVVASYAMTERAMKNETIEACARVAETHGRVGVPVAIAAAIRALKDKP